MITPDIIFLIEYDPANLSYQGKFYLNTPYL